MFNNWKAKDTFEQTKTCDSIYCELMSCLCARTLQLLLFIDHTQFWMTPLIKKMSSCIKFQKLAQHTNNHTLEQ